MTTIEEALNQAEQMSTEEAWVALKQYSTSPHSSDFEVPVDVDKKTIYDMDENVSTFEETNAEYISFLMDRYHDGIDLTTMRIQVEYSVGEELFISGIVNAFCTDSQIKFGWVVPARATRTAGVIEVMVFCTGTLSDGSEYMLKSVPKEYKILNTLPVNGTVPEPTEYWYTQFVSSMNKNLVKAGEYALEAENARASAESAKATSLSAQSVVLQAASTVQENTDIVLEKSAQASTDAERAELAARNAEAIVGVGIATKETAGLARGGDAWVDETGAFVHIVETTERDIQGSHASALDVVDLFGKTEQDTTKGNQLADLSTVTMWSCTYSDGVYKSSALGNYGMMTIGLNTHFKIESDVTYYIKAQARRISGDANINWMIFSDSASNENVSTAKISVPNLTSDYQEYVFSVTSEEVLEDTKMSIQVGPSSVENVIEVKDVMVCLDKDMEYEPFTNGASPNPEYEQEVKGVKGKNLLDCSGLAEETKNEVTFTPVYDDRGLLEYVNVNGTPTETSSFLLNKKVDNVGDVIINGCPSGGSANTYRITVDVYKNGAYSATRLDTGSGVRVNAGEYDYLWIYIMVYGGVTASNLKFYPMVRKASIADDSYVPYGCLKIKAVGKNLFSVLKFDNASENNGEYTSVPLGAWHMVRFFTKFNFKSTAQYTISFEAKKNSDSAGYINYIGLYSVKNAILCSERITSIALTADWVKYSFTFSTNENGNIVDALSIQNSGGADSVYSFRDIQIEEGEVATEYESYKENSVLLPIPEMHGFDGVRDTLESKKFKTVVFDGSDDEGWGSISLGGTYNRDIFYVTLPDYNFISSSTINYMCDALKAIPHSERYVENAMFIESLLRLCCYPKDFTTLAEWKAHLASKPMEVTYELAEPIETPLPEVDVEALKMLRSYDWITHIFVDSDEVEPEMLVECATSKVGAVAMEARNIAERNEIRLKRLENAGGV